MPQSWDMGQIILLPLRRKACWGFFFTSEKNPTASVGIEPANSGTRGQHANHQTTEAVTQWGKALLPTTRPCYFGFFFINENTSNRVHGKRLYWPNIRITVKNLLRYGGWSCVKHDMCNSAHYIFAWAMPSLRLKALREVALRHNTLCSFWNHEHTLCDLLRKYFAWMPCCDALRWWKETRVIAV
jgi:hypothetical protein